MQYKKRTDAGTLTFRQIVPTLTWELVPTPIIEVRIQERAISTRLILLLVCCDVVVGGVPNKTLHAVLRARQPV